MTQRFEHGSAASLPMHSSIWRVFHLFFPQHWRIIQIISVVILSIFSFYNALKYKSIDLLSANLLWIFTVVVLITSGVDRMNMAFIPCILIVCKYCSEKQSIYLLFSYAGTGMVILFYPLVKNILGLEGWLGDVNFIESLMCLLLTIVYFSIVFQLKPFYVPQPSRNY
jgi:hypothetical protein